MELSDIYNALATLLVLLAVLGIIVLLGFLETRSKKELDDKRDVLRREIRGARMERTKLIEQALLMFSDNNKYAPSLSKLLEIYKKIDSEKKEILWEEKYVKIMKAFIATAQKASPANMKKACKMLKSSVVANEDALDAARAQYASVMENLARYGSFPRKQLIAAGEKAQGALKFAKKAKDVYGENLSTLNEALKEDPDTFEKMLHRKSKEGKDERDEDE